jgi:hypothetical protein
MHDPCCIVMIVVLLHDKRSRKKVKSNKIERLKIHRQTRCHRQNEEEIFILLRIDLFSLMRIKVFTQHYQCDIT